MKIERKRERKKERKKETALINADIRYKTSLCDLKLKLNQGETLQTNFINQRIKSLLLQIPDLQVTDSIDEAGNTESVKQISYVL